MAVIKASFFGLILITGSLLLRAEELWYECEINNSASETLEISFERSENWADAWHPTLDADAQEAPSFTTDAYLHFLDSALKGSINVIFEPGPSKHYAFFNMVVKLSEQTSFTMSLMEDPSLGTAWGHATLGQRALALNCGRIFEEHDSSAED